MSSSVFGSRAQVTNAAESQLGIRLLENHRDSDWGDWCGCRHL